MLKMNDLDSLHEFLSGRDLNVWYGPFHFMGLRIKLSQWADGSYTLQSEYNEKCDFQLNSKNINGFYFKPTAIGHDLIIVAHETDSIDLFNIKIW